MIIYPHWHYITWFRRYWFYRLHYALLKPHLILTNTPFIEIGWTAYQISTADELYHTTWNNIEGSYSIKCPILCTLHNYDYKYVIQKIFVIKLG